MLPVSSIGWMSFFFFFFFLKKTHKFMNICVDKSEMCNKMRQSVLTKLASDTAYHFSCQHGFIACSETNV